MINPGLTVNAAFIWQNCSLEMRAGETYCYVRSYFHQRSFYNVQPCVCCDSHMKTEERWCLCVAPSPTAGYHNLNLTIYPSFQTSSFKIKIFLNVRCACTHSHIKSSAVNVFPSDYKPIQRLWFWYVDIHQNMSYPWSVFFFSNYQECIIYYLTFRTHLAADNILTE